MRKPEGTGPLPPVEDYAALHTGWKDVPLTRRDLLRFVLGILMLGAVLGGMLVWLLTRKALAADGPTPPGPAGTLWMQILMLVGIVLQLILPQFFRIMDENKKRAWELQDRKDKSALAAMVQENTELTTTAVKAATLGNDCVEELTKTLQMRKSDVAEIQRKLDEAKAQRRRSKEDDLHGR